MKVQWQVNVVHAKLKGLRPRDRSCGRNENWNDKRIVAAEVKILEIQRVVLDLIEGISFKVTRAHLELQNNYLVIDHKNRVSALPHARNGKF